MMHSTIARTLWNPTSYQAFRRYIDYFSENDPVFQQLSTMSPIVKPEKIHRTREYIKQCEDRKATLLHTGDCAEPF